MGVELGHAALEMLFEEPDLDEETVLDEAAILIASLIERTLSPKRR